MEFFIEGALVLIGLLIIVFIISRIGDNIADKKEKEDNKKAHDAYWEHIHQQEDEQRRRH